MKQHTDDSVLLIVTLLMSVASICIQLSHISTTSDTFKTQFDALDTLSHRVDLLEKIK